MAIKILPDFLINQIAAGEVIERPASVIKECVENSVDAGAKSIVVELEEGGQKLIRITDDGSGIARSDAAMVFERHATSKIANQEDLENVLSMGFRGEALASIASVSLCKLLTKRAEDSTATEILIEGSELKSVEDAAFQNGTQIEVRNIFYNTPARRKYLKTAATEYKHIMSFLTRFALSQPGISLKVLHNGDQTVDYPAANSLKDRVLQIFGRDTAENVLEVKYDAAHLKVSGFIGRPTIARKSRAKQFLFVNGRTINDSSISFAVRDAFGSIIPHGMYPFFVLFIDLDPAFVDSNVHPRKLEVRFLNPREVFHAVKESCKRALEENLLAPQMKINQETGEVSYEGKRDNLAAAKDMQLSDLTVPYASYQKFSGTFSGKSSGSSDFSGINESKKYSPSDAIKFTKDLASSEREAAGISHDEGLELSMTPIAQIADSYILAQKNDGIVLIDQHAAHERVLYERFMKNFEEQKVDSQPMLTPVSLDLSHNEAILVKENLEIFQSMGFELEEFGGDTFVIHEVPSSMVKQDVVKVVRDVLDDLLNGKTPQKAQGKKEAILTSMACRSAIMFGDKLSQDEMIGLVREMDKIDNPYTCPHGRPSMFVLSFEELEKKFGRKGF